jgi:CHAT domain-containing protein/tetratricopeptide (TPR) repeat protein
MKAKDLRNGFSPRLRIGAVSPVLLISIAAALSQAPRADEARAASPPWQRVLRGDDAKRVESLEGQITDRERKGEFAEAAAAARDVLAIRLRAQGEDHWQTVDARVKAAAWARVGALPRQSQSDLAVAIRQTDEADQLGEKGRHAEAERLHRTALATLRRTLGEEHPYTAVGSNRLAQDLCDQARYAEVDSILQESLVLFRRTLGEDHPLIASTFNDLGMNLDYQAKHAEARTPLRKALEIRLRTLGADDPETTVSYNNLAFNLDGEGRYVEAEPMLQKVLAIRLRTLGEGHPLTARSYNNLAYNLNGQGRHAEAEPLDRKALAIRRLALGEDHPLTARSYNNLATDLHDQGKYVEAEPLIRKALAIHRDTQGEDHLDTALSYDNVADNLDGQGKHVEAEPLNRKALAIYRSKLGEDHPLTARSYSNLAMNLTDQGRIAEAEGLLRRARAIRRIMDADHPDTATSDNRLAMNLDAQGKAAEAEALLREALEIYRNRYGEDHRDTALSYKDLATNLNRQGKYAEAEAMAIAAAQSYEAARLRFSFSGLGRAEFAARQSPSALLSAILARRGCDQAAWQHWEAGLARGLLEDLADRRPLTADERRRREDMVAERNHLENQIGFLTGAKTLDDDRRKRLDDLKNRRLELQGRLIQLEAELARKHKMGAGPVYPLDRIQAQLPADAALVGWLDLGTRPGAADPQGDHWACVVRRSGGPRWIKLVAGSRPDRPWTQDDDQRPGRVRRILDSKDLPSWRESLAELTEQRLKPLESALGARDGLPAVRHLIVLPSPALAGVPIEAMLEARPPGAPPYLVSYAPSGTLFAWLRERRREDRGGPAQPRHLLALGDPAPPPAEEPNPEPPDQSRPVQQTAEAILARREGDALIRRSRGAAFDRLPGTRHEVQAIAGLFDRSTVYLGSDASEQTLETLRSSGQLGAFTVIHLATHGRIDDLSPMNSRLLLSQDKLPDPMAAPSLDEPAYDGTLTAGEVLSAWKLKAELVTLSACSSGLGRQSGGEGFVGFAQSFFLAGSPSVLVSLWEVNDTATSLLMTRFYQNWLGKRPGLSRPLSKAEALQEAKAWLRGLTGADLERELSRVSRGEVRSRSSPAPAGRPFAHVHDWAGFILIGDPD